MFATKCYSYNEKCSKGFESKFKIVYFEEYKWKKVNKNEYIVRLPTIIKIQFCKGKFFFIFQKIKVINIQFKRKILRFCLLNVFFWLLRDP